MKAVYRHYREGLAFRRSSELWSEKQKTDWMLGRLREVVRNASVESDLYRERFERSGFDPGKDFTFEDFARLPALSRDEVRAGGASLMSNSLAPSEMVRNATGGSTGAPTEIFMGPEERGWSESGIEFALERIGVPAGSRIGYLWGHHLDPQLEPGFSERVRAWALNYKFFDCFRLSDELFERYHDEFERFSPDCIVAYASALGSFAEYLRERRIRPVNYPRTCFVTGAEKLHARHRDAIEEVFGPNRPVHERYGGRDFGPAAIQLAPQRDKVFTVDWTWCLIEPETEAKDSPILVTKLHGDAMPMIRYRVGDIGRYTSGSQPGRPVFRLTEVIGRQTEGILKSDGSVLHGNQIPHLMKDFPVREFMLVQQEDLSLELRVVPDPGFGDTDEMRILRTIRANTADLPITLARVDAIERGGANKWMPVVSKAISKNRD